MLDDRDTISGDSTNEVFDSTDEALRCAIEVATDSARDAHALFRRIRACRASELGAVGCAGCVEVAA
jgi:hypothetical protein